MTPNPPRTGRSLAAKMLSWLTAGLTSGLMLSGAALYCPPPLDPEPDAGTPKRG
jgi:hypothetical protein